MLSFSRYCSATMASLRVVDHAGPRHARKMRQRDVALDVLAQDQPEALAVFGDIGEPVAHRVLDRAQIDLAALHESPSGDVAAIGAAEHAHREFGAAGAHQAGDADDLAAVDVQADALDHLAAGMQRMLDAPVADLEQSFADLRLARRVAVGHFAADHALDDAGLADRAGADVDGLHRGAVAHHGDGVGDLASSLSLCEIRIEAMPCRLNSSSRASSASLSLSFRLAVGSSRINSLTFWRAPWRSRPAAACRRRDW